MKVGHSRDIKQKEIYHSDLTLTKNGKIQRDLTVYSFSPKTENSLLHWVRNKRERMSLQMKYLMQSRWHSMHSKRKTLKWVWNFFLRNEALANLDSIILFYGYLYCSLVVKVHFIFIELIWQNITTVWSYSVRPGRKLTHPLQTLSVFK